MSRYGDAYARHVEWQALAEGVDLPSLAQRIDRPAWMRSGMCRGQGHLFFTGDTGPAKALCARCPVIEPCLEYALEDRALDGVWGGTSARDRRRMRAGKMGTAVPMSEVSDTEHLDAA